jgi:hypothetical protein
MDEKINKWQGTFLSNAKELAELAFSSYACTIS